MRIDGFTDISQCLRAGVYLLVAKGVVIYVGKSRAIIARINAHRRKWIDKRKGRKDSDFIPIPGLLFDEIHIKTCMVEELDNLEREMINLYKPKYNIQLKIPGRITQPFKLNINGTIITMNEVSSTMIERRI